MWLTVQQCIEEYDLVFWRVSGWSSRPWYPRSDTSQGRPSRRSSLLLACCGSPRYLVTIKTVTSQNALSMHELNPSVYWFQQKHCGWPKWRSWHNGKNFEILQRGRACFAWTRNCQNQQNMFKSYCWLWSLATFPMSPTLKCCMCIIVCPQDTHTLSRHVNRHTHKHKRITMYCRSFFRAVRLQSNC